MESLAAVDLGSNSFHMVIARVDHGGIQIVDRLREPVGQCVVVSLTQDRDAGAEVHQHGVDGVLGIGAGRDEGLLQIERADEVYCLEKRDRPRDVCRCDGKPSG